MKKLIAFVLLLGLSCDPAPAVAGPGVNGINFNDKHLVDGHQLEVTGVALLKWALIFDIYAGAFYLPTGYAGKDWSKDIPKHLELYYFRGFKAEEFSGASEELLREALAFENYRRLEERLQEFYRLFRDIRQGDRYTLTYTPSRGTELRLNNRLLGAVPGHDFAVAYFGLWLGSRPINDTFRDRLLKGG